jgi:hypothetical protein
MIWRETLIADVGIDGHFEFVDAAGSATGQQVGVQVKSGLSYFRSEDQNAGLWRYYPEEKHLSYWEHYPLPVFLVLHSIAENKSYWVDARHQIRTARERPNYLSVPKQNVLQATSLEQIFENTGGPGDAFIYNPYEVLHRLIETNSGNASFPVSWFDLFTQGLTNIARSVYCGMDLAVKAAEANLQMNNSEFGLGIGSQEQDFIFDYIRFLMAQRLAYIDFADCLIDWRDREIQPHFIAPLTSRGRWLVKLIHDEEETLIKEGTLPNDKYLRVAQEGFFEMVEMSYVNRLPRIRRFQEIWVAPVFAPTDTGAEDESSELIRSVSPAPSSEEL